MRVVRGPSERCLRGREVTRQVPTSRRERPKAGFYRSCRAGGSRGRSGRSCRLAPCYFKFLVGTGRAALALRRIRNLDLAPAARWRRSGSKRDNKPVEGGLAREPLHSHPHHFQLHPFTRGRLGALVRPAPNRGGVHAPFSPCGGELLPDGGELQPPCVRISVRTCGIARGLERVAICCSSVTQRLRTRASYTWLLRVVSCAHQMRTLFYSETRAHQMRTGVRFTCALRFLS